MPPRSRAAYRGEKRRKEEARKARQAAKRARRQDRVNTGEKGPPIEELPPELRPMTPSPPAESTEGQKT
jgi:hypothetical protein